MVPETEGSRIVWVATGLSQNTTGIERFAVALMDDILETSIATGDDFTVYTDPGATWAHELADRGARVVTLPGGRLSRPPKDCSTLMCHNLGGGRFPRRCSERTRYLYTVYDWGPFRDTSMGLRARATWMLMILAGCRKADVTHFLNARLPATLPRVLHLGGRYVVAYPKSGVASQQQAREMGPPSLPPFGLFVGTASPRKRLGDLVSLASAARQHIVLAGDGTQDFDCPPFVKGMGRVSEPALAHLYATASCLVLLSEYEGFGLPVLEASASGLRSVISPEVAEVLPAALREYAIVCDPMDVNSFRRAVAAAFAGRDLGRFDARQLQLELIAEYEAALQGGDESPW